MANRSWQKTLASLNVDLTLLQAQFVVGSTGAVGVTKGSGVASFTRLAAGTYSVNLQDQYNRFLMASATVQDNADASAVALSTGLTSGSVYSIVAVGTAAKGTVTYTISSGSGILQATIGGYLVQTVWATSDNASATAMAAAINATLGLNQLVTATASTNTVVVTATSNPGNGITTVALGTGFTVNHASTTGGTTVAALWQSAGLASGVTPVAGAAFKASAVGAISGATSNTAAVPDPAGLVMELVGDPNATVNNSSPYFVIEFVGPTNSSTTTPIAVDPPAGSLVRLDIFLRNSSVKGKGE